MTNLSDKELDRLSREAAEQYEPDEDNSSWDKLEQLLDKEVADKPPPPMARFSGKPILYAVLLLVLAGTSYFLLKTNTHRNHATQNARTLTAADKETGKANNAVGKNETHPQANKQIADHSDGAGVSAAKATDDVNKENKDGQQGMDNAVTNGPDVAKDKNAGTNRGWNGQKNKASNLHAAAISYSKYGTSLGIPTNKNNSLLHGHAGNRIANHGNNHAVPVAIGSSDANAAAAGNSAATDHSIPSAAIPDNTNDELNVHALPGLQLANHHEPEVNDAALRKLGTVGADSVQSVQKKQALRISRPVKIGLMFAPDYTNVGSAHNNQLSTNIGITIGYEFFDRFSINSGLIYTKKNYGANKQDFHGFVPLGNYNHVDYIKGDCSMLEIPFSLRYDFARSGKTKFFAAAGLSSYLMKHEMYTFYYHTYTGAGPLEWSQPYNTRDNYWLSILNVSAGVERSLGKNFSLQVEPFINVPLIGVGFGSLQLNSYGMSFSLRYAPVLHRSRH